jgi:hypothetical protein
MVFKLRKYDPGCSCRIQIFYQSRIPGLKKHRIPDKQNITIYLVLVEECGEETEEGERCEHRHGVGTQGIRPGEGRVHS